MPTEVGDEGLEFFVVVAVGEAHDGRIRAGEELATDIGGSEAEQFLVRLVRHRVDVRFDGVAVGFAEDSSESLAVLGFGNVPAGVREEVLEACGSDVGNDSVE